MPFAARGLIRALAVCLNHEKVHQSIDYYCDIAFPHQLTATEYEISLKVAYSLRLYADRPPQLTAVVKSDHCDKENV